MSKICMGCMEPYADEYGVCPFCGYIEGTKTTEALHMEPGSILRERYIVGRVLGFGGFGVTYIGWDALLEQKVAIKEYLPSEFSTRVPGQTQVTVFNGVRQEQFEDGLKKFIEEAQRLAKFHSLEGIVKIFDSFGSNNTAYIVMEYLDGETLSQWLSKQNTVAPDEAISMLLPVIRSLRAVHEQGIIHRDIAPDNIVLTKDGQIKLIDFGASRFATTTHSRSLTVIIKPGYSPEEQYRSRADQGPYTDVYAIGATLYRMIYGGAPPDAMERRAYFESKKKDILTPLSKTCKDITETQETAIFNALNVRIEDRTQNMVDLEEELTTEKDIKRRQGKIKKTDVLKWPLWAKITAPAATLIIATLSTFFALGIIGFSSSLQSDIVIPEGMSRVPSIVNNTIEQAEGSLAEAVLLYLIVGKEYSHLVPSNLVLSQDISAGSVVLQNTVMQITISGGAETGIVPDITGMDMEYAKQTLEELGFTVEIVTEYSAVQAINMVITQSVAGEEELELGAAITLTVSLGIDPDAQIEQKITIVPNFVGLSYQEAQRVAQNAGFLLAVTAREYSSYAKDVILTQSVQADSELLSGNTIGLVVSLGNQEVRVTNVQYKTEAEARSLLSAQGLTVTATYVASETVAGGLVISQNPAERSTVSLGATVELVVSTGGTAIEMPNVVGMDEATARAAITGKGLSVAVNRENNDAVAGGTVLRQSVMAGTPVSRGATISITVSVNSVSTDAEQQVVTVTVPNVIGLSKQEAEDALTGEGFSVSVSEAHHATVAQGLVITQSLNAGTSQLKGSSVVLTVSKGAEAPPTPSVPNVIGLSELDAEAALTGAGFKVSVSRANHATVAQGLVISQTPNAGNSQAPGTTVIVTISKGPDVPQVQVPDLVRKPKADAERELRNLGLEPIIAGSEYDEIRRDWVKAQTPAAGASIPVGGQVKLTLSLGPEYLEVPPVTGTNVGTATNILKSFGFEVEYDWVQVGGAGIVVSQDPESGKKVKAGTSVKVRIE